PPAMAPWGGPSLPPSGMSKKRRNASGTSCRDAVETRRRVSMRTTAGVTASARFVKASLRSIAGRTASGETCADSVNAGIACDALVQPSPLANPRPNRNAVTVKRTILAFALNGSYICRFLRLPRDPRRLRCRAFQSATREHRMRSGSSSGALHAAGRAGSPPRAPRAARARPDAGGGSVPAVLSVPLPMDTDAPRSPGVARDFRGAPGTLDPSPSPDLLLLVHDLVVRFDHVLVVRCARGATGRGPLLGGRARPGLGLALRGL